MTMHEIALFFMEGLPDKTNTDYFLSDGNNNDRLKFRVLV